jgi:hypothetical protein
MPQDKTGAFLSCNKLEIELTIEAYFLALIA